MGCTGCPYAEKTEGVEERFKHLAFQIKLGIEIKTMVAERTESTCGKIDYLESINQIEGALVGTGYFKNGKRFWWRMTYTNGTPKNLTYSICESAAKDGCASQL